jgi:hypothetical protein
MVPELHEILVDTCGYKGDIMPFTYNPEQLKRIETMLLKEMDREGRIMVRSLDKIHARTGLTYATISEMARRLQQQTWQRTSF